MDFRRLSFQQVDFKRRSVHIARDEKTRAAMLAESAKSKLVVTRVDWLSHKF